VSGHVKVARTDHHAAAQQARELPGQWVLAGSYGSLASAQTTARGVRGADRIPAYAPAGAFEARAEITQDNVDLYVRYVDGQASSDFQASMAAGLTEDLDAFSRRLDAACFSKDA
jgi:hypothetical protein